MSSYIDKCPRPIPIGKQRYAYQCENIAIDAALGECVIRAWPPMRGGKEPYPNEEAGEIDHYNLTLKRFTGNAVELTLLKKMKDGTEILYLTNTSFAGLVNCLFEGGPANIFKTEFPENYKK